MDNNVSITTATRTLDILFQDGDTPTNTLSTSYTYNVGDYEPGTDLLTVYRSKGGKLWVDNLQVTPEPATAALLGLGFAGAWIRRRRRG